MSMPLPPPTNFGTGGSSGLQPTPSQVDLLTAAAETMKAGLGMKPDSIEQTFTEINPRYQSNLFGGFGYKASQDQPVLDHKLETSYGLTTLPSIADESWQPVYSQLMSSLPPDIKQRLEKENRQPLDQRSPAYAVLDNLLQTTAKIMVAVDTLSQPMAPDGLEAARTNLNLLTPIAALKGTLALSDELSHSIQQFLADIGPNARDFDAFTGQMDQLKSALKLLSNVNTALAHTPGGELSAEAKAEAAKAADKLLTLEAKFSQSVVGDDLKLIPSFTHAAATIAMALSLPHTGSAPLFLGLSIATPGLLDPHLAGSLDALIHGLAPQMNTGGHEFLKMQTTVAFAALIGLASQAVSEGLGPLPNPQHSGGRNFAFILPALLGMAVNHTPYLNTAFSGEWMSDLGKIAISVLAIGMTAAMAADDAQSSSSADKPPLASDHKAANFLAFSAALQLVASSNCVGEFFKEAVAVSGGDDKAQRLAAPLLTELAHLLMILAATREEGRQNPAPLVEAHADRFQKGVLAAEELASAAAPTAAVAIGQLQATLAERNYAGFIDAFTQLLANPASPDDNDSWTKEFDLLRGLSAQITAQAASKKNEEPFTGIVHSV